MHGPKSFLHTEAITIIKSYILRWQKWDACHFEADCKFFKNVIKFQIYETLVLANTWTPNQPYSYSLIIIKDATWEWLRIPTFPKGYGLWIHDTQGRIIGFWGFL